MRGLHTYVANDSTRSLIGHVCGIQHGHCWGGRLISLVN